MAETGSRMGDTRVEQKVPDHRGGLADNGSPAGQ